MFVSFSHEADDDFISESYQGATKKEMAEVNESMRRLGLGGGGKKNKQHINTLDMDRGKLCLPKCYTKYC